jgi:PPOX class probable F420-dependent enzyme
MMVAQNRMATTINGNWAAPTETLKPFVRQKTVLLTTYRCDGTPVGTPVHIVVEGDRAYFRTWDTAWKLKRIRKNPAVEVAPSTTGGTPTGPAIHTRARILAGDESVHAARAIAHKYPILHGVLIPFFHRLRHYRTMQIELTPTERA